MAKFIYVEKNGYKAKISVLDQPINVNKYEIVLGEFKLYSYSLYYAQLKAKALIEYFDTGKPLPNNILK